MKESALSTRIIAAINALPGAHAQKMHGSRFTTTGTPDIIACVQGQTLMLEVKLPAGRVSPAQKVELKRWAQAGAITVIVASEQDAMAVVQTMLEITAISNKRD